MYMYILHNHALDFRDISSTTNLLANIHVTVSPVIFLSQLHVSKSCTAKISLPLGWYEDIPPSIYT